MISPAQRAARVRSIAAAIVVVAVFAGVSVLVLVGLARGSAAGGCGGG